MGDKMKFDWSNQSYSGNSNYIINVYPVLGKQIDKSEVDGFYYKIDSQGSQNLTDPYLRILSDNINFVLNINGLTAWINHFIKGI